MNLENSFKAIEAWAIEGLEEIQGRGSPARIIKIMKDINSEARKIMYRGGGIKGCDKILEDAKKLVKTFPIVGEREIGLGNQPTYGIGRTYMIKIWISSGEYTLRDLRRKIASTQATAQNIIGIMERVNELKKNNPPLVFLVKSKSLFAEAEKYAASMIKLLEFTSTDLQVEGQKGGSWFEFGKKVNEIGEFYRKDKKAHDKLMSSRRFAK